MRLASGDRLGRFEIVGAVGAGAMGEVYRARDTELERDVAIKVLPAEVAADPSRARRFEQEARAIARLDHPNLLAIHDVGRHEGTHYLVCELLEGETLGDRLASGPLSHRQAIDLGAQIAEGLAAAHEAGVVHRDLKPANLFLTEDGRVKILDFGLAKLARPAGGDPDASPTLTAATEHGAVLGTAAYMAPEQAAGRPVDHRADQFALGSVLYESLSGVRPFAGESPQEVMAATLRDEPQPLARTAPGAPAPLRWIVERCLAKDPADRYQSTGDLARDLGMLSRRLPELSSGAAPSSASVGRRARPAVAALAVAVALAAGFALGLLSSGGDNAAPELSFEAITLRRGHVGAAAFDPGSDAVLYSAAWDGGPERLYLKRPGGLEPLPVGPTDSRLLSVSPSGEVLLLTERRTPGPFHRVGTLVRMQVAGAPRVLEREVSEAVWGPDGELLALVRERAGEAVLEYPPGTIRYSTRGIIGYLRATSDGERLAFVEVRSRASNFGPLVVLERDGPTAELGPSGTEQGIAWSPDDGELWFPRGSDLLAVDLDGEERLLASFPQRVVLFDVAPDGRALLAVEPRRWEMIAKPPGAEAERELTWLGWSIPFDISKDRESILFNDCAVGVCKVCLRGFDGGPPIVLGEGFGTALSPDGAWVASTPPWSPGELTLIATGSDERRTLPLEGIERIHIAVWSPDGDSIFFIGHAPGEQNRVFRVALEGGEATPVTDEGLSFGFFAVSPDGGRIAVPLVGGGIDIHDLVDREVVAHFASDELPLRWSADGGSLYTAPLFRTDATLHRLALGTGETATVTTLEPADPVGVLQIGTVVVTPEGDAYAYSYVHTLSQLLVVRGLR